MAVVDTKAKTLHRGMRVETPYGNGVITREAFDNPVFGGVTVVVKLDEGPDTHPDEKKPMELMAEKVTVQRPPSHLGDRKAILREVMKEREYQEEKWGNSSDDENNTPFHWCAWIGRYMYEWTFGGWGAFKAHQVDNFRRCMVQVAAMAVAAIESVDRQRDASGRTFYEEEEEERS